MAQADIKNERGFVDKRRTQGQTANQHSSTFTTNTRDVTAMRTRLTAINGSLYTAAYLDKMTENDMLYALRVADEAAGI